MAQKQYYYEDFEIGQVFESPARTITETDVITFAAFTADNNYLHTNEEVGKKTVFGGRVAHGMLGASYGIGLWTRLSLVDQTSVAFLGTSWDFKNAILIGDTIQSIITIGDKRMTKNPGRGIVQLDFSIINQRGDVCQTGMMKLMLKTHEYTE